MKKKSASLWRLVLSIAVCFIAFSVSALAQTTAFNYQGHLSDGAVQNPTGTYQMKFTLHSAVSGDGNQLGSEIINNSVAVANGVFTVELDFGGEFSGAGRWLEISVKKASETEYTKLSPRPQINSAPYAIRALAATSADSLSGSCAGCVADANINSVSGSKITGSVANADNAANATNATNATTATTATTAATASSVSAAAGDSVVSAINASSSSVTTARVSGDVEFAPSAQQTATTTNHLLNLKLVGARNLGTAGQDSLLSLSASGHYQDGNDHDKERFRVENDGSILAVSDYNSGCCGGVPIEGSGTRFMWFGAKAAIRAGGIDGTQWDDANIGLYSTAFGQNVRALGDNAVAIGKSTVAANTGTVALGEGHTATGANSIALGYGASTSTSAGSPRLGSFVFADRSTATTCPLYSNGSSVDSNCQFHAETTNAAFWRVTNGFRIYTSSNLSTGVTIQSGASASNWGHSNAVISTSTGAYLSTSGVWTDNSSRNLKTNFTPVNPRLILQKVLSLPITTWNYKVDSPDVRHIGVMAQDFYNTFQVGADDEHITPVDTAGVSMAAIQGLNEELKDELKTRDAKIENLEQQLKQQQTLIEGMKKMLCAEKPEAEICRQ